MKAKGIKRLRREVKRLRAELDHVHDVTHGYDCPWFERTEAEIAERKAKAIEESTAKLRAQAERDDALMVFNEYDFPKRLDGPPAYPNYMAWTGEKRARTRGVTQQAH